MNFVSMGEIERRQHSRITVPQLYVRVGQHIYRSVEWSFGGLVVEDPDRTLATGALLRIDGLIDEDAYRQAYSPAPVDICARGVRVCPTSGHVALSCLKIDDAAYGILSAATGGFTAREASLA